MSEHRCTCGNSVDFFTEYNSNQCGLYCGKCGKWQKWINKQEERLFNHRNSLAEHDAKVIDEIEKLLLDRFTCDDLRTDWTNADIRETIHFEFEQLKENTNE